MHDPYKALYIHVPFCKQRCRYCDFATQAAPAGSPLFDEYTARMLMDIRKASRDGMLGSIETVYIGGGTPSYLGHARLTEILYMLSLSMRLTTDVECSMEANPESLTDRMVKDIFALGVNRLSIGVQSFDDEVLGKLGRIHDAAAARRAVETAHERFDNVSVDLMCGVPGQTRESFRSSVRQAIDLDVSHVSVYPLTIEPGTPFYGLVAKGRMDDIDPDAQARQMEDAESLLREAGFERYEVASYAKPGFACRHNKAYWTGIPYLGLGPSVVTMTQNAERRMRKQDGQVIDDLDVKQMRVEDIMLGMRMSEGVSDGKVAWAAEVAPELPSVLRRLEENGLVMRGPGRWMPTERGWICGNDLYEPIFELAP
ncbi:radical SAM family heme chaperone HemW [Curtanaerobium respiraculi]|uniref:radical SAM family heme chaperone HemW n=1 Tax=Curtanaerobium respiraculi TaxID=2949669 RepID=UPI0024B35A24|nr:radical SAM family heme chaperone HemW [Curtanaerobium respiraculi]